MNEIIKQKNGQAGPDGNGLLRNRRIELRVSPKEYAAICSHANAHRFNSIAQYVREQALGSEITDSATSRHKAVIAATYELNKIGVNINQMARQLNSGQAQDQEMLMVLLQIQDLAEENLKRVTYGKPEAL